MAVANRFNFIKSFIPILLLGSLIFTAVSCSEDKGFKKTKTKIAQTTKPSKTPILNQPCSLLTLETAASILGTTTKKLGSPESSEPDSSTLRCRYAATSDDGKLFLVLNVYVYEKQSAYDLVKKVNKGKEIETSVDEGFYFNKTTTLQSERFVAARDGKARIGVSSSIAIINPDEELKAEQIVLPEVDVLSNQVGIILSKV